MDTRLMEELRKETVGSDAEDLVFSSPQGSVLRVQNFRRRCFDLRWAFQDAVAVRLADPTLFDDEASDYEKPGVVWRPRQESNLRHTV
ncbi:MAG: hypothetical protein ACRDQA_05825 [Nocardioidaceae bacterium]